MFFGGEKKEMKVVFNYKVFCLFMFNFKYILEIKSKVIVFYYFLCLLLNIIFLSSVVLYNVIR